MVAVIVMFVITKVLVRMAISLYSHQLKAIEELRTGSILCGGVGTGKSRTSLAYFYLKDCKGSLKINGEGKFKHMEDPKDLYIITTARKRDTLEWESECAVFVLSTNRDDSIDNVKVTIDSWNNIEKYSDVKQAFFIFDEQRVVGKGKWVKNFIKISKNNNWILLSATPGDTWMDYIPVFVANGFYKNRTEFIRRHVVYDNFSKFPKVDHYVEVNKLVQLRNQILVDMPYEKKTVPHVIDFDADYDKDLFDIIWKDRWNPFMDQPIRNISEMCNLARRCVNLNLSRFDKTIEIIKEKKKVIIFYNFDYELSVLRQLKKISGLSVAEWNGHKHESIPKTDCWAYLVQYNGSEAWNCIETDTIIFYSQNYSYRVTQQASGRIDRLNTPFVDLYYYNFKSKSVIDKMIFSSLKKKKDFNERSIKHLF